MLDCLHAIRGNRSSYGRISVYIAVINPILPTNAEKQATCSVAATLFTLV